MAGFVGGFAPSLEVAKLRGWEYNPSKPLHSEGMADSMTRHTPLWFFLSSRLAPERMVRDFGYYTVKLFDAFAFGYDTRLEAGRAFAARSLDTGVRRLEKLGEIADPSSGPRQIRNSKYETQKNIKLQIPKAKHASAF
jgi:hypothetical protein